MIFVSSQLSLEVTQQNCQLLFISNTDAAAHKILNLKISRKKDIIGQRNISKTLDQSKVKQAAMKPNPISSF
jgi:hypothetical protein